MSRALRRPHHACGTLVRACWPGSDSQASLPAHPHACSEGNTYSLGGTATSCTEVVNGTVTADHTAFTCDAGFFVGATNCEEW